MITEQIARRNPAWILRGMGRRRPRLVPRSLLLLVALGGTSLAAHSGVDVPRAAAASAGYTITDLGTLGGAQSEAIALQAIGQDIVGSASTGSGAEHAFLWLGPSRTRLHAVLSDLGTLAGGTYSIAEGINAADQVAGESGRSNQDLGCSGEPQHAFFWSAGTGMIDIGSVNDTGCGVTYAHGINDNGWIVGSGNTESERDYAFLWSAGTGLKTLDSLLSTNSGWDLFAASAINDAGQIVGTGEADGAVEGYVWNPIADPGSVPTPLMPFAGGGGVEPYAINANGWVAGAVLPTTDPHVAFLARPPVGGLAGLPTGGYVMTNLGTLPGDTNAEAYGINVANQVVGQSGDVDGIGGRAFIYSNGTMTDLNTLIDPSSGWVLNAARAINDDGQITGYGTIGGTTHAFLLTPVTPTPRATTTVLSSSRNPAVYGQSVQFTATVAPSDATGSIQFQVDGAGFGPAVTLADGSATSGSISSLDVAAAPHTISAVYTPADGSFTGSSDILSQSMTPAALTITANDQTMVYGELPPSFTAGYSGFANGEGPGVLSPGPACTATDGQGRPIDPRTPAGTYAITCSGALDANYTIGYVPGILTVAPRAITVGAVSVTTVYGRPTPPYSIHLTSGALAAGDSLATLGTPAFSTMPATPVDVGSYPIAVTGLSNADYAIGSASGSAMGTLTITPAQLTVTATNVSKVYGQPNPPMTVGYSGFVNGDTAAVLTGSPTCGTTATTTSLPGTYPITCTAGTLEGKDYSFVFVPGTLTIGYGTCLLYDPTKAVNSGSAYPVKVQMCTADGANISSASLKLTVTGVQPNKGMSNSGGSFRFDPTLGKGGGYIYTADTTGFPMGSYTLLFMVTGDPVVHRAPFTVK
jgi:probable HAF family extracellular repeat protein